MRGLELPQLAHQGVELRVRNFRVVENVVPVVVVLDQLAQFAARLATSRTSP